MLARSSILTAVLLEPSIIESFVASDWELCIRQARSSLLLTRLAITIREQDLDSLVPVAPRRHLNAAMESHRHLRQATRYEVEFLLDALENTDIPLVLLKGAAYEMADLPPGRCRTFNDIDLLVPRDRLHDAEMALLLNGWITGHHDAYDDRYYRTWMHEIPPLRHLTRESVIDVHHNLVPETAPFHPDPLKLLTNVVACPKRTDVFVLAEQDMILHSAVHLFNDGEFDHGLRDLFDIRDLVIHSIRTDCEWLALFQRAKELDLSQPLYHAVRYLKLVFGMQVPDRHQYLLANYSPSTYTQSILDHLFLRGLQPDHPSCADRFTPLARYSLYLRGHAMRMPMRLLVPHLVRKGVKRFQEAYYSRNENNRKLN